MADEINRSTRPRYISALLEAMLERFRMHV
ncbi:hypothetical protein AWU82_28395 [Pseudomonas glycinae]|uniref:Uncharacterized protein n=1 Tax=Pseudomonas glycinae TaxID=1785145 RepID=A0ABN5FRI7_9PSED|nr:hypothetical protein AWU82_28395 [Pseudomonas glycinae]